MEESNEEASLNQICLQPFESPRVSQSFPPQTQTLNSDFDEQKDEVRTEEEEAGIKEDVTVTSIPMQIGKPANEKTLARFTIGKIQNFYQNFKPKQISSSKKQSLLAHEDVFRSLNLWEFLNLDFESEVRSDLIVELICTYDKLGYYSFVRGFKIGVGKFDFAHALKVPVEKNETHESVYSKDETKDVILRFLSGFVLLDEEDEDMCILPEEAIKAIKLVKIGAANEVDWCGLIWSLVEKDIVNAYASGYSKFASYLHCLIKAQCPNLLLEDVCVPKLESHFHVSDSVDIVESSSSDEDEEEYDDDEDESKDDPGTELSLGNNDNVDLMNDIDWNDVVGSNEGFEFDLRRCNNSNSETNMELENFCQKNDYSNDLLQSYTPQMNLLDENLRPSSSSFYEDNIGKGKRHLDADDTENHYHQNNNQQKRMRIDTYLGEEEEVEIPRSGFNFYSERLQSTIGKAEMLYVDKEQACMHAHLQLQCLNELLMRKDEEIENLQKAHVEEQQSWELVAGRYRHELNVFANLAFSYRNALKETQKKFDEYRKMCPGVDEFLYHDAVGPGGSVLTPKERNREDEV